jgi:hypothetical protein
VGSALGYKQADNRFGFGIHSVLFQTNKNEIVHRKDEMEDFFKNMI